MRVALNIELMQELLSSPLWQAVLAYAFREKIIHRTVNASVSSNMIKDFSFVERHERAFLGKNILLFNLPLVLSVK